MTTIELRSDWRDFLITLIDRKVRFLVIGGHAVAVHGEPRFTKDLDVWVDPTLVNARRLHDALVDFGLGSFTPKPEELAEVGPFWMFGRPPGRIDILTEVLGLPSFRSAWSRRTSVQLDKVRKIPLLGRDDLLSAKRAAARPQDLADAASIELFAAHEQMGQTRRTTQKKRS